MEKTESPLLVITKELNLINLILGFPLKVNITDGSASFPDLNPGELGGSLADHFAISVDPLAPDGVMLGFDMVWSADGGATGASSFSEQVVAVQLKYGSHTINDYVGGNGNGVAGPDSQGSHMEFTCETCRRFPVPDRP